MTPAVWRVPFEVRRVVDQPLRKGKLGSCLRGTTSITPATINIPALHISDDTQIPRVFHLDREPAGAPILPPRHGWDGGDARSVDARGHEAASIGGIAMAQSRVAVAPPGEDAGLGEQAAVHVLPPGAIVLNDGLVGHSEGAAGGLSPVRGLEPNRGLLQGLAGGA